MAPALQADDNAFAGSRDTTHSLVMAILGGGYTDAHRATTKATTPKDKGVQAATTPIADSTTKNRKVLRGWASMPGDSNRELTPGLAALIDDEPELAEKRVMRFCPRTPGSSRQPEVEHQQGALLLRQRRGEWVFS